MEKVKKIVIKYEDILFFMIAVVIVSFMRLNLTINGSVFDKMAGNSLDYVIYSLLLAVIIKKVAKIKDKRMNVVSGIVAVILTICQILGYLTVNGITVFSKSLILKAFGYFAIFYVIIMFVYNYIKNHKEKTVCQEWKLSNKKIFFGAWAIIFVCYVPYLLKYFPGIGSTDSIYQMYQATGKMNLINTHPIFHTFCISIAMKLGMLIGDNYNTGVLIYSIAQMLFMSGVYAFCLTYMKKKGISKIVVFISLIYFALYPAMPMYSVTMWKDIPLSISILLYTIAMVELATNSDEFLSKKRNIAFLIISALLTMFFKHNGFYIVLLSAPFVIFFVRKYWKKLAVIYVFLIVFYKIINGPVLDLLNVSPTYASEALSIPIQGLARVVATCELNDDEVSEITEWIQADKETIEDEYNPRLSDPMKHYFNNEKFEEDKVGFIKVWFKYLVKYPMTYFQAFLSNTYGYWYPETQYWMFQRGLSDDELGLYRDSKLDIELFDNVIEDRTIPVVSMISSLGFVFWITGIMMFYAIYEKRYKLIIVFIPVMILWLTAMASSVFCEFRYMFGFFTSLPIIISVIFMKSYDSHF